MRYRFGGIIFGGAYFQNFTVLESNYPTNGDLEIASI